jgi:LPXTG-site transpeptidase (sortase) family protein
MSQHPRGVIGAIAERPKSFAVVFIVLFFLTVTFLASVDALPEPAVAVISPIGAQIPQGLADEPVRVVATSVGLDVTVENPSSSDITILDEALLRGAVRYPTSAKLGVDGTVLLFGHSSYLPVVYNQAYKAFNNIQDLKTGERISVYSSDAEYRYKVTSVRLADASEDVIELPADGRYLTLVTCDSFGRKTSRFVVTAEFEGASI